MAFKTASYQAKTREDISSAVYDLAEELMEDEQLIVPEKSKPWRASDIKADCPRQVYYSRHESGKRTGRVSAAALFGTAVHEMFDLGASRDFGLWEHIWAEELSRARVSLHSDNIDWRASSKPFSLSGFQNAAPEEKIEALFFRYDSLDRVNHEEFWARHPFAIYRHPESGRLAQEMVLRGEIAGRPIVTTADAMLTHVYTAEILPADWKTGRASEFTQLATYAMIAEQQFGLVPGSIARGMFVLTGAGEAVHARGKLPHAYEPDPDSMVVQEVLDDWRETVVERVDRLEQRERSGVWRPKLNPLCYRACEYRHKCPVGIALQQVREQKNEEP